MLILKRFNSFELFFNANEDIPLKELSADAKREGFPPTF